MILCRNNGRRHLRLLLIIHCDPPLVSVHFIVSFRLGVIYRCFEDDGGRESDVETCVFILISK